MAIKLGAGHKLRNLGQTLLLIVGMLLLLTMSSWLLFGAESWWWMLMLIGVLLLGLPSLSPYWILRLYRARPLHPQQAPQLFAMLDSLSERADLPSRPELFWVPSQTLNAFTVGSRKQSAIAVTDGLLGALPAREIMAVLAHEVSHIHHDDLRIMMLADVISRLTHLLSTTALLVLLALLPFLLLGEVSVSIGGLILIIIAPTLSALLQLGLSRVREFDADLGAARLTQDPAGLASALTRIEQQQINPWLRLMFPGYRDQQPSVLRSHPATGERVQRLLQLRAEQWQQPVFDPAHDRRSRNPYTQIDIRRPRRRFFSGTWH